MTPAEVAAKLRAFNEWRRGDEDIPQPDPREIGEAIDAAVEMIDRLEAAESDAAHQKALAESALRVAEGWERKCGELRAKIEAMEKQVPICRAEDLRHAEILLPSLGLMPEDKLYALPGAKGEGK